MQGKELYRSNDPKGVSDQEGTFSRERKGTEQDKWKNKNAPKSVNV